MTSETKRDETKVNKSKKKQSPPAKRFFVVSCLFCDQEKISDDHGQQSTADESRQRKAEMTDDSDAYWICPACAISERERTEALEATLLLDRESCTRTIPKGCTNFEDNVDPEACNCQACVERRDLEMEQQRELRSLQKAWVQLRHAMRHMYRDGLDKELKSGKGKQFDEHKLKELVHLLVDRDAHQLYQRLESQGREYVMEMKVNLLQIIVSPDKVGLELPSDDSTTVSLDQAKLFLKSTLDYFSRYQDTVRNMYCFMQELDRVHLEKFGITWKVINHHLFDAVVYQDSLIVNNLPAMAKQLGVELVCPDDETDEDKKRRHAAEAKLNLPPAALELAQSFRALDKLMRTSREIWEKANQRMEDYTAKQMRLYKATLKAKQKMLKEDLEFFKQQRRLLERYVSKSKDTKSTEQTKTSSEEELAQFAETLRNLLANGRRGRQHTAAQVECTRCNLRHCPCDECTISHVITCGLVTEDDQDLGPLPTSILDEMAPFEFDMDQSSETTTSSDSEDDTASDDDNNEMVYRKDRTLGMCSDMRKVAKRSGKYSGVILPAAPTLFTLHDQTLPSNDVQQHLSNVYGDWELPYDPTARLFSGLPADLCRRDSIDSNFNTKRSPSKLIDTKKMNGNRAEACGNRRETSKTAPTSRHRTHSLPLSPDGGISKAKECLSKALAEQLPFDASKIPPDVFKLMKEETLAKAFTMAAANRGYVKRPPNDQYYNWKDLEKIDWKDMNVDAEALKRFYEQHAHEVKVVGETKLKDAKSASAQVHASVACQVETAGDDTEDDDEEEDDDEDSWSGSSERSGKDGRHCDCCYCEMFGHGGGQEGKGACGRAPQIRERLRLKLKRKETERVQGDGQEEVNTLNAPPAEKLSRPATPHEGTKGDQPIDTLLEFINGPQT
uniref:Uncharacterized protein n=1 Tax=Plectus sambesii TaxID=2011161 RepID=A0A914UN23_9BILA